MGTADLKTDIPSADDFIQASNYLRAGPAVFQNERLASLAETPAQPKKAAQLAFAIMASVYMREDKAVPVSGAKEKVLRAHLHASVVTGAPVIEELIAKALYHQAAALIRQELESGENLRALRLGGFQARRSPSTAFLKKLGLMTVYAQLTGLAHMTDDDFIRHLFHDAKSGLQPRYLEQLSAMMLCTHTQALLLVAMDMAEMRPFDETKVFSPTEHHYTSVAFALIQEFGFARLKPAPNPGI